MTDFDDFDVEDVAAMRREGDFREFLRSRMSAGPKAARKPEPWKPPPGHRPGAWPPGTRPPARPAPAGISPEWQDALNDYRALLRREVLNDNDTPEETL